MRLFGFDIKRAKAPRNAAQRRRGGGNYRIVTTDQNLREPGIIERGDEIDILDQSKRGRLLDMARNQVRNSSTFAAMLKQFELNAVGTVGGKATFALGTDEVNTAMREAFARWARSCEFFDGLRLNSLLRTVLKTYLVGGECVLLFDDGLIEDSGKVLLYEPDEMGNLSDADFAAHFPAGWQMLDGHILNENGRLVGVVVSRYHRGEKDYPFDECYKLVKDPNESDEDSLWINPRNMWRKNQVIGVSPIASSLASVVDLEDLCNYELQSAKQNSQTLAQVIQDKQEDDPPGAFETGADVSAMTDAEVDEAAAYEAATAPAVSLNRIKGAGCLYEVMPEGTRLDLLDTKHPNPNMPAYIDWQAGRAVAPLGLSRMFATMKVEGSFSACQGEINMSWPAFEDAQQFLEYLCDWIITRWTRWAARRGELPVAVPDDIARHVSWSWPRQKAVNAVDEQTAIEKRLRNYTGSYAEIYGADWREKLAAIGREIEWCKANGIVHPAMVTVSGAPVETVKEIEDEN